MSQNYFKSKKKWSLDALIKDHAGFTAIELLVVIAITAILALAAIPVYGNLQTRAQYQEISSQVVQSLRSAKIRAESGLNDSSHGVYFEINPLDKDVYTIYQGESYVLRFSDYDLVFNLDKSLSIANIDLDLTGQDIDINFSKGVGLPNNSGSLKIYHSVSGEKTVVVGELGQVQEN